MLLVCSTTPALVEGCEGRSGPALCAAFLVFEGRFMAVAAVPSGTMTPMSIFSYSRVSAIFDRYAMAAGTRSLVPAARLPSQFSLNAHTSQARHGWYVQAFQARVV